MEFPKLNKDPMSILVSPKTVTIDLKKIKGRSVEEDPIFSRKYTDFISGKGKCYISRIPISSIKPGFYKHSGSKWDYFVDKESREDIEYMKTIIRGGYRPALYLYQNSNFNSDSKFLCPDDVVTFHAYSELGIKFPPVIVLGSKNGLEESAFSIKGFLNCDNSHSYLIYDSEPVKKDFLYSLLGEDLEGDVTLDLSKINRCVNLLKSEFREFHSKEKSDVEYHTLIFSMVLRVEEMVRSIRILIDRGLHIQSGNILRSLYELSITFYICWISPHEITQFVQISSAVKENDWKKYLVSDIRKLGKNSLSRKYRESINKAMNYQYRFSKSVVEKARFSPFGESFYRDVYSFLSDIAHHDFSMSARYRHSLEFGDDAVYDQDVKDSIVRIVDLCVANILVRVADDIGFDITSAVRKL